MRRKLLAELEMWPWHWPRGWRVRWNQDVVDVVLAVALTGFVLRLSFARGELNPVTVPLLLLQTLPLAARRRFPLLVCAISGISLGIYSGIGFSEVGGNLGVLFSFYTIAANRPRQTAAIAAAFCAGGIFLTLVNYASVDPSAMNQLLGAYLEYALAWIVGDYLRVRRAYTGELEERARRLEAEREERARRAVTDERTRIARELHDVVAHHVSVMVVQAAAARRVCDVDTVAAKDAIEAVETAGRTALGEMRRMLQVLREEEAGVGPQPTLAQLDRLVGEVREAGLPVELEVVGEARDLPAGVDLAAFRIVQEALTNTVKHAGKASARVRVTFGERDLEIEVVDDGRGAAAPLLGESGGHGLVGMRERVLLYGGVLEAGPVLAGGFRVHARLPIASPRTTIEGDADMPRPSVLDVMADEVGGAAGVPFRGSVYPWPKYP